MQRQGASSTACPSAICAAVPERAVLVGEQHEVAVPEARGAARLVEQHERQESVHLGLVGHQLGERAAEPERLGRRGRRGPP